jgi:hypothetical protein
MKPAASGRMRFTGCFSLEFLPIENDFSPDYEYLPESLSRSPARRAPKWPNAGSFSTSQTIGAVKTTAIITSKMPAM